MSRKIEGSAFYAHIEHAVVEHVRQETKKEMLTLIEAREALYSVVHEGFQFDIALGRVSLGALYFMRDKRTLKGSFFDKTLGLRAFYIAADRQARGVVDYCFVCDDMVYLDSGSGYMLRSREIKEPYLWRPEQFYLSSGSVHTTIFGGTLMSGMHETRWGLLVCEECGQAIARHDPHAMSLFGGLFEKADKAYYKEQEKIALQTLPWRERSELLIRESEAKRQKSQLIRGAVGAVAAKFVIGSDGVMREVEVSE